MAAPRKAKETRQDPILEKDDKVLEQASNGPDGTGSPVTWKEKAQAKAKAQDASWLRGWFKARNPKLTGTELKDMVNYTIAHYQGKNK
jgi:hypothetical protein